DPMTFESRLVPNIHVVGDAAIMGAMPKSAFAANSQAKVCAAAVAERGAGQRPARPKLINTCYSVVAPDYGFSVEGVYEPKDGQLGEVPTCGATSPRGAPAATRTLEASFANGWFNTITGEIFG